MLDIVMACILVVMVGYFLVDYFYFKSFAASVYDSEDDQQDETIENEAFAKPRRQYSEAENCRDIIRQMQLTRLKMQAINAEREPVQIMDAVDYN